MNKSLAIGIIRISSTKQGLQGDSPDDQKKQIQQLADQNNLEIKHFFEFWESGAKEIQPVLSVLDFCRKNIIKFALFKSIDRFTRGGGGTYLNLVDAFEKSGVKLLDCQHTISNIKNNTLGFYDVEYDWSKESPTRMNEILMAEHYKKDRQDILTRLIGAEIRYSRAGYWIGGYVYGYEIVRKDSPQGKRTFLQPLEAEATYIRLIFKLMDEGKLSKQEIVDHINGLGYKSRIIKKRPKENHLKHMIIGYKGGTKLNLKQLDRYLTNPIYCGIRQMIRAGKLEKPVEIFGEPIITRELFNKINKGGIEILETETGEIHIIKGRVPTHLLFKQVHDDEYPFKPYVLCPKCRKPLYASASTGKLGKHYPAYHHNGRIDGVSHYFRVPLNTFNETISKFVKRVKLKDHVIMRLKKYYLEEIENKRGQSISNTSVIDSKIQELQALQVALIEKIELLNSPLLIKKFEEKVGKMEIELGLLQSQRNKQENFKSNAQTSINQFWYYLEHLEELMLDPDNPIRSAKMFSLIFTQLPTYEDLTVGTPRIECIFNLNHVPKDTCEPAGIRTQDQELKRLLLYH
jgi:site-specific DNA recombinase